MNGSTNQNSENDSPPKNKKETSENSTGTGVANKDNESGQLAKMKSLVRIVVTAMAALFLFGGGGAMIWFYLDCCPDDTKAKDIFMTILPVASAIVSFWFAGRLALKNPGTDKSSR